MFSSKKFFVYLLQTFCAIQQFLEKKNSCKNKIITGQNLKQHNVVFCPIKGYNMINISKYKELTVSFGFPHLERIKILQFLQKRENYVIKSVSN